MKITVAMIMAKKPCEQWTEERVASFIGKGKTLNQILEIKDVSADDRIWCATRFLTDKQNRAFTIWCARQCETKLPEIKAYIDTIEKFYKGEATPEELDAADGVAYGAAGGAASRAAYWAAYWAAYGAAGGAAMRNRQIKKLLSMIGGVK